MERTPDMTITVLLNRIQILEAAVNDERRRAEVDALTGIGNLLMLERRSSARGGWFVMADLNGFKQAQDSHPDGHVFGDTVLKEFASFLVRSCRDRQDRLAIRKGGDEFVIWCQERHGARAIKERIRKWKSIYGDVTAAAGLGSDIYSADAAMYIDKGRKQ